MFDFDAGKLIVIGVVALVVIGPKELPRVMRQVGQTVGKLRRMAADFQSQFMEAMREAEMADVKDEMGKIAETAKLDVSFDPVRHIRNEIGGAFAGGTAAQASGSPAALADLPSNSIDLSALETAPALAGGTELADGGLVGPGLAPTPTVNEVARQDDGTEAEGATETPSGGIVAEGIAPAPGATLDEVRDALTEQLASATTDEPESKEPVKEPTA